MKDWKKLQDVECPECGCPLIENEKGYNCCSCDFKIGKARFEEIVNDMYTARPIGMRDEVEDNLSDLNNL